MPEPELDAMNALHQALDPLDQPARERVLRWAAAKFDVNIEIDGTSSRRARSNGGQRHDGDVPQGFAQLGDLVDATQPASGPDRALVAGYWFQEVQGGDGWTGGEVNSALKNMGSGLANVTKTLDALKAKKPALVMQVAKTGRSRQARKTYKLTTAGIAEVERRLSDSMRVEVQ